MPSYSMCSPLGAMHGFVNLTQPASGLRSDLLQVQDRGCIVYLMRQELHASRGATRNRVATKAYNKPAGRCTPFLRPGVGCTSRLRCARRLLSFNRSTIATGACFTMVLTSRRMCLVILVDETLNVGHQLGTRFPAVMRRRIAAPAHKVTRSLPLHVTVVQDTLHVKALSTV